MTAITLLTVLETRTVEQVWRPVFHDVDAVLLVGIAPAERATWAAFVRVPVVAMEDLLVTDGEMERRAYVEGTEAAACVASALYPITINNVAISFAMTPAVVTLLRQEVGFLHALEEIARGRRHVAVVTTARAPWLMAGLRRFVHAEGNRLRCSYLGRKDVVEPLNLGLPKRSPADEALSYRLTGEEAGKVRFRATGTPVLDKAVHPNCDRPVLAIHTSQQPLYLRHTVPVLAEAVRRGVPVWVLLGPGVEPGPLAEIVPEERIFRIASPQDETELGDEVTRAIKHRWGGLYLDHGGTECLVPLELARGQRSLRQRVEELRVAVAAIRLLLTRLKPRSLWLSTARSHLEEIAISAAALEGVPCVTGLAALTSEQPRNLPFTRSDVWVAAYGEQLVDTYRARSMPVERFVKTTGAPHLDYLYRLDPVECRQRMEAELGAKLDGRRVIGIMTSRVDPVAEDAWLIPLARKVARRKDLALVLKPHPARLKDYQRTRKALADLEGRSIFWSAAEPGTAIAASDVVVTDKSAIAIEVAVLRRPLIQVRPGGKAYDYNDFVADGIAVGARDARSILAAVDRLAKGLPAAMITARAQFLRQYNWGDDGRAAERVADLLVEPAPPVGPYQSPFIGLPLPD